MKLAFYEVYGDPESDEQVTLRRLEFSDLTDHPLSYVQLDRMTLRPNQVQAA